MMDKDGASRYRGALGFGLLALIVANLAMAAIAVGRYPAFFAQRGARLFLLEPISVLLVYAVGVVVVARTRGPYWDAILKTAIAFGAFTGILEVVNIGIENGIPFGVPGSVLPISSMAIVFTLWGIAGFRTARSLGSVGAGILAAVSSACICMLIAVAAGFAVQFFLAPPDPSIISTWAEYKRSGWTDARAFGIANTLDSGFTHLVVAPVVATLFGSVGTALGRLKKSKT